MPLTDDVAVRRRISRQAQATHERREQILDAAVAAFNESGFNGTSIRDVAARVGMSHTGVLHHFPDKAALLEAVLDRRLERAVAEFPLETGDGEVFLRSLVALAERDAQAPDDLRLYCTIAAEALSPTHPAHGYFTQWYHQARASVLTALRDLERRGHFTGHGVSIETAAVQIASMRDGLNQHWLLAPDEVDLVGATRAQLRFYTDLDL